MDENDWQVNTAYFFAYRAWGGIGFSNTIFLPFIRSLDGCACENMNKEAFQCYGKNLVKVMTEQLRHNQLLLNQFQTIMYGKVEGAQLANKAILAVYTEFSKKVYNTRLNEFLDTYRRMMVAEKGKAILLDKT